MSYMRCVSVCQRCPLFGCVGNLANIQRLYSQTGNQKNTQFCEFNLELYYCGLESRVLQPRSCL